MPFTPAYAAPPEKEKGQYKFSLIRVLVIGVMLSILVAICLCLHHTAFVALEKGLINGEHKNSAWIATEIGYMLPFVVICIFQYAVYVKHDRQNGIVQKEMAWQLVVAMTLTYAVLLPIAIHISDAQLSLRLAADAVMETTEGNVERSIMMEIAEWFIRLAVPMLLLWIFHASKAKSEITPLAPSDTTPERTTQS